MLSVLALLSCLVLPPTATVVVAGDSVVVTVAVADNAAEPVTVDSVGFYIEITGAGAASIRTGTEAHTAGVTTHRFAYPLSLWAPNETKSGLVGARRGHTEGAVTAWSDWTYSPAAAWSYTRTVPAPAVADSGAITVPSVGLN